MKQTISEGIGKAIGLAILIGVVYFVSTLFRSSEQAETPGCYYILTHQEKYTKEYIYETCPDDYDTREQYCGPGGAEC